MGILLSTITGRVKRKLRDREARRRSYPRVEVDQAVCDAYIELQARLPAPHLYTPNAFSITAEAFTMPATAGLQYDSDIRIQLRSNGMFLIKYTREEIDALRQGLQSYTGRPTHVAFWEDSAQAVQGLVYPPPGGPEAVNTYVALAAADLRDGALDAASVLFSRTAAAALELYVAADLLAGMGAEDAKLRRINPGVAAQWRKDAEVLLYREAARRHNLESVGRIQRWIS